MPQISYLSLYNILRDDKDHPIVSCTSKATVEYLYRHISTSLNLNQEDEHMSSALMKKIIGFTSTLMRKWSKQHRTHERFVDKEQSWLSNSLTIGDSEDPSDMPSTSRGVGRGRPEQAFSELSVRQKRRRTEDLRSTLPTDVLCYAASSALYMEGKHAAADLILQATQYSPNRSVVLRQLIRKAQETSKNKYTEELLVDCHLTKESCIQIRRGAKDKTANIYPSYKRIIEAKKRCYPQRIEINESGAAVPLQNLLDHTCQRLIDILEFPEDPTFFDEFPEVKLIVKWGCDGSSNHNQFMQHYEEPSPAEDTAFSEKHVFMFSMVLLKMFGIDKDGIRTIFGENPKPSSVKYCRPIKYKYIRETQENARNEIAATEREVEALTSLETFINDKQISIQYHMVFTMLDTKIISAITETGSQNCYLCGCRPSDINNLNEVTKLKINEEYLKYALSVLHAWIKFLECILHISYKLEIRKGNLRGVSQAGKDGVKTRKSAIQEKVWKSLGLRVDRVVQGCGTSNTGNVARRFFSDPPKAAAATGVDEQLIFRFSVILQALASGEDINESAFDTYALDTARLFVSLYGWYNMPPTVHKILIHGSDAVKYAVLPIGQLSEEAQESRNKDYRRFRTHHTRKNSRINTTTDLLNRLLISSDPVTTGFRKIKEYESKELVPEAKYLLKLERLEDPMDIDEDISSGSESE